MIAAAAAGAPSRPSKRSGPVRSWSALQWWWSSSRQGYGRGRRFHNSLFAPHGGDELPRLVRLRPYTMDARPQLLAVEVLPLRRHLEAQEVDAHDQQGRRGCEVGRRVEAHGSASGAQWCSAMLSDGRALSKLQIYLVLCQDMVGADLG